MANPHLDKAIEITTKVKYRIQKIQDGVEKFQSGMLDTIQRAHDAVTNATNRSQKAIDKELQRLQTKYDGYHEAAQKWVDEQLKQVQDWMNVQIDSVQRELKESSARIEAQIIECAEGREISADELNMLISAIPDIDIPRPTIPEIKVPKPDFPYPNLDLTQIAEHAMAATQIESVGNQIATTKLI